MRNISIAIFFILINSACRQQSSLNSENANKGKVDYSISNAFQYDTLTLFARYKECGEWGGHTELFKIYRKKNQEIWAEYKKDTVNCKGAIINKLIYSKTIKLAEKKQEFVIQYLHDLLNRNFIKNDLISNAGEYYSAISSDSSLVISHWTYHYDGFNMLMDKIIQ